MIELLLALLLIFVGLGAIMLATFMLLAMLECLLEDWW